MARLQAQLEKSLDFLGVTAIEDQLQPCVEQTIKSLKVGSTELLQQFLPPAAPPGLVEGCPFHCKHN